MKCLKSDYTAANTEFKSLNCQNFKARVGCARERQQVKVSTTTTCCAECTAHKPHRQTNETGSQLSSSFGISNILSVPHQTYNYGFVSRMFCYAMLVMTRKVDTNFVDVSHRVLKSECVECAVKDAAREQFNNNLLEKDMDNSDLLLLEAEQRSRVVQMLGRMRTCISSVLCRIASWVLFKLFSRLLTKIYINNGQIEMLRRCRTTANVPIIYLPLHRSHLDYILLTFILYMNNIKPPLVAAGDNLLIPFFGNLMRGLGAFFIRRRLDYKLGKRDHVYRAVLQQYMKENLREGHSMEFFIEGGRSRSGKALMPKSGLLSVVVDSILEGVIDNAYIVPVSISYEKIFDGSFAGEQLGKPKISESFTLAFRSIWSTLRTNFGAVRVDFCQPYSLKDYLEHTPHTESNKRANNDSQTNNCVQLKCAACSGFRMGSFLSSQFSVDIVALMDKRCTIEKLAEHVVYDAFNSTTLMATHMVAFLLLNKHRRGVTLPDLAQSLDWMRDECYRRKRDIGFTGESKDAIRHAIVLLGKQLISINKMSFIMSTAPSNTTETANSDINMKIIFVKPSIKLPHVHDLQYFSNSCVSLFQMNSIVSNSLSSIISSPIDCLTSCGNNDISNITIDYDELINKSLLLCDILQFDFIFVPPCQNVQDSIHSTIEEMKRNGILIDAQLNETVNQRLRDRFRLYDIEEEGDNDGYYSDRSGSYLAKREMRIILKEKNINEIEFYLTILAPYIESYWLAACALMRLIGSKKKIERLFYAEMMEMAKDKLTKRLLNYEECISMDTFRNAVKLFEKWKIVQIESLDNGSKQISLNPKYNCENAIDTVILKIENYKIRSSF